MGISIRGSLIVVLYESNRLVRLAVIDYRQARTTMILTPVGHEVS